MTHDNYSQQYRAPILAVDGVVFVLVKASLQVLLVKRANQPFKGSWALPGGYNPEGETTQQALGRIMRAKTGVDIQKLPLLEQLYTFDTVARDPRGHAVAVTYLGLGGDAVEASLKGQTPTFFDVDELPDLAYDHEAIVRYARSRLQSKISYTTAMFALLASVFTLTELQTGYEAVLGSPLDKRNFRKKYLAYNVLAATGKYQAEGAHRPAQLYRFKTNGLQNLTNDF